jgi:hypothetical protein
VTAGELCPAGGADDGRGDRDLDREGAGSAGEVATEPGEPPRVTSTLTQAEPVAAQPGEAMSRGRLSAAERAVPWPVRAK